MNNNSDAVLYYHQRTKHQLNAYAKGPGSLDWEDQPNPFRRFVGSEQLVLPKPGAEPPCLFAELDRPENIPVYPLDITSVGLLMELSFGLSAWKQFGPDRWALRCNPSSGNLHPTEAYVLLTGSEVLPAGVYHYVSQNHQLEHRGQFEVNGSETELYIGLSSIHWREAWKYGERAFRYCQHDLGHALAALSYAAACLGWSVELCSEVADSDISQWLGLDRAVDFIDLERESADCLCRIRTARSDVKPFNPVQMSQNLHSAQWFGTAERLSQRHFYQWPLIDEVACQCRKPGTDPERWAAQAFPLPEPANNLNASRLIRQRRSAQNFNGKAENLPLQRFNRIMLALLPNAKPPFTAWNWSPQVHLMLLVHRVEGLVPGLYFLVRHPVDLTELKQSVSADFIWEKIDVPYDLYRLTPGNVRQAAKTLSCHQPIASDSFFSLGMLTRFVENIEQAPWLYRRLFWECGLLGQILYLEAEAAGVRGTGIGCFFDDAVHGVLGLQDNTWQSLYHFTVGEALDDARLQTLAAYEHLGF